jgi:hypothetical protein
MFLTEEVKGFKALNSHMSGGVSGFTAFKYAHGVIGEACFSRSAVLRKVKKSAMGYSTI